VKTRKEITQVTATRVDPDVLRALKHLAVEEGTSVAALLCRLATQYVHEHSARVARFM
jgi:hypothetical protein